MNIEPREWSKYICEHSRKMLNELETEHSIRVLEVNGWGTHDPTFELTMSQSFAMDLLHPGEPLRVFCDSGEVHCTKCLNRVRFREIQK